MQYRPILMANVGLMAYSYHATIKMHDSRRRRRLLPHSIRSCLPCLCHANHSRRDRNVLKTLSRSHSTQSRCTILATRTKIKQRISFAAETNAACSRYVIIISGSADTHSVTASVTTSSGEGNMSRSIVLRHDRDDSKHCDYYLASEAGRRGHMT